MRLLIVTHYYAEHRGGVEIIAAQIAERLARRGIDVVWAASAPEPRRCPVGVAPLPMRAWNVAERRLGFPYPLWGPGSLRRLARAVRQCDVVHLHDCLYLGNLVAYACARRRSKPVVVTQHIGEVPYSSPVLRFLLAAANKTLGRMVLSGSTRAVFYSEKVRRYFARILRFAREPAFIANGVAADLFFPLAPDQRARAAESLGWPPDRLKMLFVGRFVEKKGLPIVRRLAELFPQCEWIFAGWGPESPERWGLPNVRIMSALGHEEIAKCYQAADLLVLPSVGEGFPLVIQEAMACGTPTLISRDTALGMPGIEEVAIVADREMLCFEAAVREVVQDPSILEQARPAAARFAREHWDWNVCADHYAKLLEGVASRGQDSDLFGREHGGHAAGPPATPVSSSPARDRESRSETR